MARALVFQCGACRSLVSADSAVAEADRAGLSCEVCGAVTWLPFTPGLASAARAPVGGHDDGEGGERPGPAAYACCDQPLRAGGLTATSSTALQPMASTSFSDAQRGRIVGSVRALEAAGAAQPELSATFERLLGRWDNGAAHKQFLQQASLQNQLAFAGQHYRAILAERPNDAVAKKAQSELLALAMASMSHQKGDLDAGSSKERAFLAVAIIAATALLCGAIVVYLPRLLTPEPLESEMPTSVVEER